jgi:hypothetical protein
VRQAVAPAVNESDHGPVAGIVLLGKPSVFAMHAARCTRSAIDAQLIGADCAEAIQAARSNAALRRASLLGMRGVYQVAAELAKRGFI